MPLPMDMSFAIKKFFPSPTFTQIFDETVANALDAGADTISIRIVAEPLSMTIGDNGAGFTDERFERFSRLMEPKDVHHKGLGRLIYLHYFSLVSVKSVFGDKKRTFKFSNAFEGNSEIKKKTTEDAPGTIIHFDQFIRHRLHSKDDIRPENIKRRLLEHFLPILHDLKTNGKNFNITIELDDSGKTKHAAMFSNRVVLTPADIPPLKCVTFTDNTIDAFAEISMKYAIQRTTDKGLQLTAIDVDGRTIPMRLLSQNAIPLECTTIFLFESKLFGQSDSARQRLVFSDGIPQEMVIRVLRRKMSATLNEELPEIQMKNTETQHRFEAKYPHLLGLFDKDTVGIVDADEALKNAQQRFFQDQKTVLESETLDEATYEKTLEISSRALTEYILYREFIIKRLKAITGDDDEKVLHNLIAPQRQKFDDHSLAESRYINNAWLLDEKFMTFRTLLSEAKMQDVIAAIAPNDTTQDEKRPDISMIFSGNPTEDASVDVVIVELKRRRPDLSQNLNASTQLLQRAMRLVNYFPKIQRIWYFAVLEIDEVIAEFLLVDNYTALFSRGKHVYYREYLVKGADGRKVPTPIYLLSFDSVIADAAARNHAFLEILKDHFKRAAEASKGP